ncbi:RodZ domain-containing protein [Zoogloea sp.]|uniref:RodZ domain-containing protein n=1 Tax=Zoogloea sp. TaxID=49181 RepID=UPI0026357833|nr:RodZ domain-containing protein [Zoogloea sp.]MDD3353772.1 DUF4115 domain-containing protein [Zoogloea sp.]
MTENKLSSASTQDQEAAVRAGLTLRQAREAQGMSVAEVAHTLKLNLRQIHALESGQFEALPGHAFIRGFLRNYARLLKIDPTPLMEGLVAPAAMAGVELAPASNAEGALPQVGRGRFRRSVLPGALAALGLFGIVLAGWYYDTQRSKPAQDLAAGLPPSAQGAEAEAVAGDPASISGSPAGVMPAVTAAEEGALAPPVSPQMAPSVEAPAAVAPLTAADMGAGRTEGGDTLIFEFAQDAWVEIKDKNGRIVFSQLGKAGARQEVKGQLPLALVIGNARHVKLQRNGAPVDLALSTKATVARLKLE